MKITFYLIFSLLLIKSAEFYAETKDTLFISSVDIKTKKINLGENTLWSYHPGDDPQWALPGIDESDWIQIDPWMSMNEFDVQEWTGIGWFRKIIRIDSSLINTSLGLYIHHEGASEIYLNGKKVLCFGIVAGEKDREENCDPGYAPYVLNLDTNMVYTLAVRYSNQRVSEWEYFYNKFFSHIGFSIELFNFNNDIEKPM